MCSPAAQQTGPAIRWMNLFSHAVPPEKSWATSWWWCASDSRESEILHLWFSYSCMLCCAVGSREEASSSSHSNSLIPEECTSLSRHRTLHRVFVYYFSFGELELKNRLPGHAFFTSSHQILCGAVNPIRSTFEVSCWCNTSVASMHFGRFFAPKYHLSFYTLWETEADVLNVFELEKMSVCNVLLQHPHNHSCVRIPEATCHPLY